MRGWRRVLSYGRRYQTLVVLGGVVLLFYWFQFFSHKKLNGWNSRHNNHELWKHRHPELDQHSESEISKHKDENVLELKSYLRGVHRDHIDDYKMEDGMFHCLKSKQVIKAEFFNDDFCDCVDFTDEPGTAACPNSRFYCKFQMLDEVAQFVPSSRVNDGICDCCDGSDEWAGVEVPPNIKLTENKQGNPVFHAPCRDHCEKYTDMRAAGLRIHTEGLKLKQIYIEAAQVLTESKRMEYGPLGVFYKLSLHCYKYHTADYEYDVCPFQSVRQQKFPQAALSLGHIPQWQQLKTGDYRLLMGGGDSHICPGLIPRQTLIRFLCGLQDEILNIREDDRCVYVIKFSTPAAC